MYDNKYYHPIQSIDVSILFFFGLYEVCDGHFELSDKNNNNFRINIDFHVKIILGVKKSIKGHRIEQKSQSRNSLFQKLRINYLKINIH